MAVVTNRVVPTTSRSLATEPRRRRHHSERNAALQAAGWEDEPLRVLLAEDDDDMRRLLSRALRASGFEVVEASSGDELLDYLSSMVLSGDGGAPLDLIVSDVRMPGMNGLEVLSGLRRSDWATPVILITAFGEPWLHAEAKRLGAVAVLNKPFTMGELRNLVCDVLGV